MTAAQRNTERTAAAWLQARGWRRSLGGQWAHDELGQRRDAAAAVQAQTRHERAQAALETVADCGILTAIEKADAAGLHGQRRPVSPPAVPGGEHD